MFYATFAIWGGALIVLILLLAGTWIVSVVMQRRGTLRQADMGAAAPSPTHSSDTSPRTMPMVHIAQQTEAVLAALAQAIEQERQKLGVIVRNPSPVEAVEPAPMPAAPVSEDARTPYGRVLPLADAGMEIATIARQLNVSEAEVSLVMHMNGV